MGLIIYVLEASEEAEKLQRQLLQLQLSTIGPKAYDTMWTLVNLSANILTTIEHETDTPKRRAFLVSMEEML